MLILLFVVLWLQKFTNICIFATKVPKNFLDENFSFIR